MKIIIPLFQKESRSSLNHKYIQKEQASIRRFDLTLLKLIMTGFSPWRYLGLKSLRQV